jgi:hypothetical protein
MSEPNVVVTDEVKRVTCGQVTVGLYIGAFGYVTPPHEVKYADIPDLITALHTALDIATEPK